jgi:hypothetical protein
MIGIGAIMLAIWLVEIEMESISYALIQPIEIASGSGHRQLR